MWLQGDGSCLIIQVFSNQVSTALRCFCGEESEESAMFTEMFFYYRNVSNYNQGKRERNLFKDPYRNKDDFHKSVIIVLIKFDTVIYCVVAYGRIIGVFG